LEAEPLAMFRDRTDDYVMNRDRLLHTAVNAALDLSDGYSAVRNKPLSMPGREVWQEMIDWLERALKKGKLTPHDVTTGSQIAMIVTGGDVNGGTIMNENEICALERKGFLTLAKTEETRARIEFMLQHGRPLRN
jgi:3-hydroxyacyl-CoA dehydrogenase